MDKDGNWKVTPLNPPPFPTRLDREMQAMREDLAREFWRPLFGRLGEHTIWLAGNAFWCPWWPYRLAEWMRDKRRVYKWKINDTIRGARQGWRGTLDEY